MTDEESMLQLCSPDDCIIIEDIIKSFIYRRPRS